MTELIIGLIIIFLSASIQGISSFGFSLVAVPLLALILPLNIIVPILVLFSLILNIIVVFKLEGHVNKKQMILLVAFGLLTIPLGIYGLKVIDENIIKVLVGIVLIVSVTAMQFGVKVHFKNQNMAYALAGIFSGVLNGASSLSGPPVILLLSNEGVDKNNFRKTLSVYFMTLNLFSMPMFLMSGILTGEVLVYAVKYVPALLIGTLFGIKIGNRIPDYLFKKLTLVLIFVMGILTIVSGL